MSKKKDSEEIALRVIKQVYGDIFRTACASWTRTEVLQHMNETIVAGGAIRDTIFGKEVRDIDIFVPKGSKMSVWKCEGKHNILYNR